MDYAFTAATQALLNSGKLVQVITAAGQLMPIARDPVNGQFVEIAKHIFIDGSAGTSPIQPLLAPAQLATGIAHIGQTHLGFQETYRQLDVIKLGLQTLQNNVGVLQATTAFIGVGTVVGVALSAVNVWQTLKLRKEIKQLRLEVKDGFIDLKKALHNQGTEIIQRLDLVAQEIKFEQHRTILAQAYGRFLEATRLIKTALSCEDMGVRNADLANARQILTEALGDYKNPRLLSETCAAGQLRRMECAWAIEQTIALTYQLQNQPAAVSDRLSHLQSKIRDDSLTVIDRCESHDELDFLFPEITRIQFHDLAVLEAWQNQVDWINSLSPDERQQLASAEMAGAEPSDSEQNPIVESEPLEQLLYENLKQKSHYQSLRDQLRFIVKPTLRRSHESYIAQQAAAANRKALAPSNWQEVPDLTVANLYYYFQQQEKAVQA